MGAFPGTERVPSSSRRGPLADASWLRCVSRRLCRRATSFASSLLSERSACRSAWALLLACSRVRQWGIGVCSGWGRDSRCQAADIGDQLNCFEGSTECDKPQAPTSHSSQGPHLSLVTLQLPIPPFVAIEHLRHEGGRGLSKQPSVVNSKINIRVAGSEAGILIRRYGFAKPRFALAKNVFTPSQSTGRGAGVHPFWHAELACVTAAPSIPAPPRANPAVL